MYCNKCGNKLNEGAKFCNKCGASTMTNVQNINQQSFYKQYNFFTVQSGKATITIDDDKIRIKRSGMVSFNAHGLKGEKTIMINQISAVQLKLGGVTIGYIQFILIGSQESKGGLRASFNDENSVCFDRRSNKDAQEIKNYIENFNSKSSNNNITNVIKNDDKYDKLKKLKELLDNNVISQEEFENEKTKILNN